MSEFDKSTAPSETPDASERIGVRLWGRSVSIGLAGLIAVLVIVGAFLVGSALGNRAREFALHRSIGAVAADLPTLPKPSAAGKVAAVPEDGGSQGSGPERESLDPDEAESQVNILLLGSDERIDGDEPPRTDTMLLVTLDLRRQTAGMISLPRDLWVPIPGYNLTSKINTAYAIGEQRGYQFGGAQLAKDTVSSFIGQPIQYYVQADFSGFVRFVDEIGGVTVNVPQTIYDPEYPTADYGYQTFYLEAGLRTLDGETALKYARTRNMDSDYGRAARQQQLIGTIVDKVFSADMLPTLIARAPQLVNSAFGSVRTDMPLATAVEFASHFRSNSFELRSLVLDDRFGEETYSENGAWILLPNRDLIRPELKAFFFPESGGSGTATAPVEPLQFVQPGPRAVQEADSTELLAADIGTNLRVMAAREARLEILNGTDQAGIAAQARRHLEANGWRVVAIGDADRSDYEHTILVNYNTDETLVRELGRQLDLTASLYSIPGLLIPESTDLRIVIGEDFLSSIGVESQ